MSDSRSRSRQRARRSRSRSAPPPQGSGNFTRGEAVQLHGLRLQPHLNGMVGTLGAFNSETCRWQVKLTNQESKAVKPANLRRQSHSGGRRLLQMPRCGHPWRDEDANHGRAEKRYQMLAQFQKDVGEAFTPQLQKRLLDKWGHGQSRRYREVFKAWLDSAEMDAEYKKDGNVFYHPDVLIGQGAHAKVFLGISPSDGREVAVKVYTQSSSSDHFTKEVEAMKENAAVFGIVQYITSFEKQRLWEEPATKRQREERTQVVILELMEGTLEEAMESWKDLDAHADAHLATVHHVAFSLLEILRRLNPVGESGFVHRDIKPDNIMVDCKENIRLSDFGIARMLRRDEAQLRTSNAGSFSFTPPEAFESTLHKTSDLYSAGRVMLSMMLADPTLARLRDRRLEIQLVPQNWPGYKRYGFFFLVQALTADDKESRGYFDKLLDAKHLYQVVLSHPFFWTAERTMNFLTQLGNLCQHQPEDSNNARGKRRSRPDTQGELKQSLTEAVKKAIWEVQGSSSRWWFEEVRDLERGGRTYEDWHYLALLKFIRNKCLHEPQMKNRLCERLPALAVCCWESLLGHFMTPHFPFGEFFGTCAAV